MSPLIRPTGPLVQTFKSAAQSLTGLRRMSFLRGANTVQPSANKSFDTDAVQCRKFKPLASPAKTIHHNLPPGGLAKVIQPYVNSKMAYAPIRLDISVCSGLPASEQGIKEAALHCIDVAEELSCVFNMETAHRSITFTVSMLVDGQERTVEFPLPPGQEDPDLFQSFSHEFLPVRVLEFMNVFSRKVTDALRDAGAKPGQDSFSIATTIAAERTVMLGGAPSKADGYLLNIEPASVRAYSWRFEADDR